MFHMMSYDVMYCHAVVWWMSCDLITIMMYCATVFHSYSMLLMSYTFSCARSL